MTTKTKAAHSSTTYHAPVQLSTISRRTTPIIDDFDRYATFGAVILGVAFGVMMLVGAWFGWI